MRPELVRASRARDYRQHFNRYALPALGSLPLTALSHGVIERFRRELLDDGLKVKTVKNIIAGGLRAMWRDARVEGAVSGNPFALLRWPRMPLVDPDPCTEEERQAICRYFRLKLTYAYAFVLFLFHTGMRLSEATVLRWSDVDTRRGTVRVRRSRHLGEEGAPKRSFGRWATTTPTDVVTSR